MENEPISQTPETPIVPSKPAGSKTPVIILLILVVLLVAAGAWYFFLRATEPEPSVTAKKVSTSSAKTGTSSSTPSDVALIKKALAKETSVSEDSLEVAISQQIDIFAKGTVSTKGEETGGGYFLAFKDNGNWSIVYNGQATPDCSMVNPFGFPISLAPECLDANGGLVERQ